MKTTLDINDELLIRAKALSARERKSLTLLIEEGLRLRLRRAVPKSASLKTLPIYHGKGGLQKGIDSRSNRALLDAADTCHQCIDCRCPQRSYASSSSAYMANACNRCLSGRRPD